MRARRGLLLLVLAGTACRAVREPAWIDLFDGRTLGAFAATEFGGDGEVRVADGRLHLGIGSPLTGVTWTAAPPRGDYELELVARRETGSDFFCGLTFPVGDSHLTLILGGWGGSVCGLSSLDGHDASRNETRTLRHFAAGCDHTIGIQIRSARVDVTVDGAPLLGATLAGRRLSLRPEVWLSRPLGLATFASAASVQRFRWRALLGNDPAGDAIPR